MGAFDVDVSRTAEAAPHRPVGENCRERERRPVLFGRLAPREIPPIGAVLVYAESSAAAAVCRLSLYGHMEGIGRAEFRTTDEQAVLRLRDGKVRGMQPWKMKPPPGEQIIAWILVVPGDQGVDDGGAAA